MPFPAYPVPGSVLRPGYRTNPELDINFTDFSCDLELDGLPSHRSECSCLYRQICPNGHLPLTVICVIRPHCFCPYAADSLLKPCPKRPSLIRPLILVPWVAAKDRLDCILKENCFCIHTFMLNNCFVCNNNWGRGRNRLWVWVLECQHRMYMYV
jgi:hypothetical protein